MTRKSPAAKQAKQKRLSPEARRQDFIRKATELFSEEGFNGGTRELARRLGVTQPLLYRYFPHKDALIEEVYRTVYLEPLNQGWETLLSDRSQSIRDRLRRFYAAYTELIFSQKWLRIYFFAALKGLDINRWYVDAVQDKILSHIIRECRHAAGLPVRAKPGKIELEQIWILHSGIFYHGVRKYIFEADVLDDRERVIASAVDLYLSGVARTFGKSHKVFGVSDAGIKAGRANRK